VARVNAVRTQRVIDMVKTALEPLGALARDPAVVEIMANPDGRVWYERVGEPMVCSDIELTEEKRQDIIEMVAGAVELVCHREQPRLLAIIPEYRLRFRAWVPPVAEAPTFVARKPALKIFTLEDYVRDGIMTPAQRDQITAGLVARKNMAIAGGTGTGKTTLANACLVVLAGTGERLLTLEAQPELRCEAQNRVALYTQPGLASMRDLVQDALQGRPDRILVGEGLDGAVWDMLKAWNTGHPGGLCTIHADSVEETFERFEDLAAENPDAPPAERLARRIRRTIDMVVFLKRTPTGRIVEEVYEAAPLTRTAPPRRPGRPPALPQFPSIHPLEIAARWEEDRSTNGRHDDD
jgi:type IV secretion system protein TrbB